MLTSIIISYTSRYVIPDAVEFLSIFSIVEILLFIYSRSHLYQSELICMCPIIFFPSGSLN